MALSNQRLFIRVSIFFIPHHYYWRNEFFFATLSYFFIRQTQEFYLSRFCYFRCEITENWLIRYCRIRDRENEEIKFFSWERLYFHYFFTRMCSDIARVCACDLDRRVCCFVIYYHFSHASRLLPSHTYPEASVCRCPRILGHAYFFARAVSLFPSPAATALQKRYVYTTSPSKLPLFLSRSPPLAPACPRSFETRWSVEKKKQSTVLSISLTRKASGNIFSVSFKWNWMQIFGTGSTWKIELNSKFICIEFLKYLPKFTKDFVSGSKFP